MRRFYPEEVIRRFTFTSILRKIEIIRWIGYSEGKKIRIRMHVSESPEGDSRPFGSTRPTSTYVRSDCISKRGLDRGWKIRTVVKVKPDDKTEKSRRNGWPSNATFKSQVWKVGERWSCIGCQVATQVLLANLSLFRWGTFFRRELRQCESREGAYVRPGPPPRHYPPGRRKLDQTTLAGAQRSCRWLFHFHRAVFWPDRTRSCPQPQRNRKRALSPPNFLLRKIRKSIHPSILRPSPRAFSRSFAGREVEPRGV